MKINRLALTNYRNYTRTDIDFPEGAVLLTGKNAQGKTTLLEAIYFLATFTSFSAGNDRQLINFYSGDAKLAVARLVADFDDNGRDHRLELRIINERNSLTDPGTLRKEALYDGVKVKLSDAYGLFNAVLFVPDMLNVISGSPNDRRKYFDVMFAQVYKSYANHASVYRHALSQRNALLKTIAEKGRGRDQLDYWNNLLVEHGSAMMSVRANSLEDMSNSIGLALMDLTAGREALHVSYNSSFPTDFDLSDHKLLKSEYAKALHSSYRQDIQYGSTTVGPHRDEYRFIVNDIDLGHFGSRGQLRSAMHALKFGEADWMRNVTGRRPVILLDEAFSELDVDRRRSLLRLLDKGDQSVVTVSDVSLIEETSQFVTAFHVENGIIHKPEPCVSLL